ncbi:MAG: tyrosine-type recombinase/integrase [Desulfovibrionaceae bacterium]|nr:tyrosine-type recombinase/integrase [Desulfovibrionaceae bacterium]MBF0514169.1 tyrosine-type recombinase/integrase [Desulfovibrionaceae bacterium]
MALTDIAVKNAKPGPKTIRLRDERGLYLEISPKGGKWWRLRYTFGGKANMLSLGVYPDITLKDARTRRDEARKLIANGVDPSATRKASKAQTVADAETFEAVTREWFSKFSRNWTPGYAKDTIRRFEQNLFPWIGERPIAEISATELLPVIKRIEARGAIETAHRVLELAGQVFRYAVACGKAQRNCAADLKGAIPPAKEKHLASITDPKVVAALLRDIDGYKGTFTTYCALRLTPLFFVRPGELRHAEWSEIDMDKGEWRIPAAKMKMREQHIVPLSRQALKILREIHPLTGAGKYVFPSEWNSTRPMSENTINLALRRMGYEKDQMTAHGFRSMASTLLNELGYNRDWVERQLAHAERNSIRGAYNFAEYLPDRRRMMQDWADYLDSLKTGTKAI